MTKVSRRYFEEGLSTDVFDEICGPDADALRRLRLGIAVLDRRNLPVIKAAAYAGTEEGIFLDLFVDASLDDCTRLAVHIHEELALHNASVLPPALTLALKPLSSFSLGRPQQGYGEVAEGLTREAVRLMHGGNEIDWRLAASCAYIGAYQETHRVLDLMSPASSNHLMNRHESLVWRLRRHRSVEARMLAELLGSLRRLHDGAQYDFLTPFDSDQAAMLGAFISQYREKLSAFERMHVPLT